MSVRSCPTDADLAAFASGEMSVSGTDGVAAHLTDCAACRLRLDKLDEQPDDLVLAIRRGTKHGPSPASPSEVDGGSGGSVPLTAFDVAQPTEPPTEGPGARVGPYRLLQLLGEGGFGSVFLAEQTEPVRRQVALKLVKLGMDTRQVLARFKAERQALAMMDHPHIARVLDAGTTDRGRPYFVMELAKGVAITEYCDTHHVPPRKRLELFADVCGAVQHAHTKGVIHRDLKPSNVLITMRDDQPSPKVIDFGIAKAVGGGRLTDQTLYTELRQFIGTPEYMSPEQADPSALDVDARTDVYSLGVLLYELLTGSTPFDPKALRSKGIDQIGRTIRETDPPKPSTRIGTLDGESLYAVAQRRGTEPRKLQHTVKGELDWIVMKCLEKDRTLRYETPNALAMDVRRYLNDEPVRAGPPSTAYQLSKFARRHRASVTAAAAVAAALLAGLGLALHGWTQARADRDVARNAQKNEERERGRAESAYRELGEAAAARRLDQADAVATASPAGAIAILDALREDVGGDLAALEPVRARFRERSSATLPGALARIRAACALTLLGAPAAEELVDAVGPAPASEGRLLIAALGGAARASAPGAAAAGAADGSPTVAERLTVAFNAEPDARLRARLAISLLFIGDPAAAARMLSPSNDPTPRSAFVAEFGQWHGDLSRLPELLDGRSPDGVSDDDFASGVCLAAGRVDADTIDAAERRPVVAMLERLYRESPSGAVHSAAAYALGAWRTARPLLAPEARQFDPKRGWYVTPGGLTMVRVPAGFGLLGWDGPDAQPVLFTRPLYVADREVPFPLFKQFAEDASVPEAARPAGWNRAPEKSHDRPGGAPPVAVFMNPAEAMRFCNWLSAREGLKPCYDFAGATWETWTLDPDADGYRLPTDPEWEYFTRAGSGTVYACGGTAYLQSYATLVLGGPHGGSLPSRWGLFDTLGGSWEITSAVPTGARPAGVEVPPTVEGRWPAVDPRTRAWTKFVYARGGADDSGARDLRSSHQRSVETSGDGAYDIGFRVVRNALPADAPGEVTPPDDVTELWLRGAEQRPWDPATVKRGVEYAVRTGHERARRLRWKEAADLFARATKLKRNDPVLLFYLAALSLQLEDAAAHRAACMQLLGIAMGSGRNRPDYTERAAKAMLLDPNLKPGPELYATEQAMRSVAIGAGSGLEGWLHLVEGMAHYRQRKYEPALAALRTSQQELKDAPPGRALAEFFLAMALHQSGDAAAARATFNDAAGLMPPDLQADPNADWDWVWIDWLNATIARREAGRVLDGPLPAAEQR